MIKIRNFEQNNRVWICIVRFYMNKTWTKKHIFVILNELVQLNRTVNLTTTERSK